MNVQVGRVPRLSARGFGYIVIAVTIAIGVPVLLLSIGAIWAQIVAGIFIAAIAVPVILGVLMWVFAKSVEANFIAAVDREAQRRAEATLEARRRRERSRQTYDPGVGFLGER